MNSSEIRNEAKNYIDQLSPDKLILVIDFLRDLQEEDDIEATEELSNIPGFERGSPRRRRAQGQVSLLNLLLNKPTNK